MHNEPTLWQAVRWPLLILAVAAVAAVAAVGIAAATVLDRTSAREYALVLGAPALTVLLPAGSGLLVVAVIRYAVRRRRATASR